MSVYYDGAGDENDPYPVASPYASEATLYSSLLCMGDAAYHRMLAAYLLRSLNRVLPVLASVLPEIG